MWFLNFLVNPKTAALVAALWVGRPDIADDLIAICDRESKCQHQKTHARDAHLTNKEWFGQVRLNHLNKECQKRKAPGGWATHGSWGLSAGAHHEYMPDCYQPKVFDNVYISALVAARKYIRTCWAPRKRTGWCKIRKKYIKARRNNIKSPRLKYKPKTKKPDNWAEFLSPGSNLL